MNDQVFDLDYIKERAKADGGRIKFIEIYKGHVVEKGPQPLFQRIDKLPGTNDFGTALDFFKAKCFGNFTARFSPSGEVVWFQNQSDAMQQPSNVTFPGAYPMQGFGVPVSANGSINYQELLQQHLQSMQTIVDLRTKLNSALEELTRMKQIESKFGYVVDKFFHKLGGPSASPMQGTAQAQPATDSLNISNMPQLEQDLSILVELLGEDGIHKAAVKLQADPAALTYLLNFLNS